MMTENSSGRPTNTDPKANRPADKIPSVDTTTLFSGAKEVVLVHKGEPYRLRQTHSGKLILTK